MRTLAIGDIHGCVKALEALLQWVAPGPEDQLVFLGDYIDRGPASRRVVERLIRLSAECRVVFLRGNHEIMILEAREDPLKANLWQGYGGLETLVSYGVRWGQDWVPKVPEAHWAFFESTARFLETERHIFVHACLDPVLDMAEQPDWLLFWEFFEQLNPHKSGKRIICGHSARADGRIAEAGFAACIDTGVYRGGWLTCLEANTGEFWQANEKGATRTGSL